jgi:hypothetical protein
MVKFDPSQYSLKLVNREAPRPWSWAILKTGLKNPIQRSTKSFASEFEASQDGEAALNSLVEVLQSRRSAARPRAASSRLDDSGSAG